MKTRDLDLAKTPQFEIVRGHRPRLQFLFSILAIGLGLRPGRAQIPGAKGARSAFSFYSTNLRRDFRATIALMESRLKKGSRDSSNITRDKTSGEKSKLRLGQLPLKSRTP